MAQPLGVLINEFKLDLIQMLLLSFFILIVLIIIVHWIINLISKKFKNKLIGCRRHGKNCPFKGKGANC